MTMCMSSWFIRTEMFKKNRIISLISSIICLNLLDSKISAYLLLTSQLFNYVELNLSTLSTKNSLLLYRLFDLFTRYCANINLT